MRSGTANRSWRVVVQRGTAIAQLPLPGAGGAYRRTPRPSRRLCSGPFAQSRSRRAFSLAPIERQPGKVARIELADCHHSPHRNQPEATLAAIADFVATMTP
jgi:hypothetical protein